ncbi:MAG: transcriptional repressor [Candidatus Latescibacterota bacterium]
MKNFQRNTTQRKLILEELRKLTSHPTAAELYDIVRKRLPKISLGTVYRNLDFLSERGLIRKLDVSGTEKRFDIDLSEHYHVQCAMCGRIEDATEAPRQLEIGDIKCLNGYEIIDHRLEFIGICPDCRTQEPSQDKDSGRVIW